MHSASSSRSAANTRGESSSHSSMPRSTAWRQHAHHPLDRTYSRDGDIGGGEWRARDEREIPMRTCGVQHGDVPFVQPTSSNCSTRRVRTPRTLAHSRMLRECVASRGSTPPTSRGGQLRRYRNGAAAGAVVAGLVRL
jgi:hypothetical protein